jgi:hypothetical protein
MSAVRSSERYAAGELSVSPSFFGKSTIACPGLMPPPFP